MEYTYLDLSVFNKFEKIDSLPDEELHTYSQLKSIVLGDQVFVPYSNAHISDLHRGYIKNPSYAPAHLKTISEFTNNLCIVQYWGENQVKWHHRDPNEFMDSTIRESDYVAESFSDLLKFTLNPELAVLSDLQNIALRLQPLPEAFQKIFAVDPIFKLMYPRSKLEMNMLALCEDLYAFSCKIKTDYALYKQYRKYLNACKVKFQQLRKTITANEKHIIGVPSQLSWEDTIDSVVIEVQKTKTSYNPDYEKIVDLFTRTDLKGYRADERFANLIDDALHTFYAAHCDYFLTLDKRCRDKAKKVFEKLKISTHVMCPEEYIESKKLP